ncbi:hypothetical protein M9Y10_009498 [Tritrichomonas musculus]|uniref:Uncharacterized protein n=1 Tax=Tritrichomonas musculus TaxID=1915356 RepID=A0ABR2INI0_9EUKA
MKSSPSREDMVLLSVLNLTRDEFIEYNISQIALNTLRMSILYPEIDSELAKMAGVFKFIGNKMIDLNTYLPEFDQIAIKLINEGSLYQTQESVKFLNCISMLLPIEAIIEIIQSNAIIKICDLINCESTASPIESSLSLLLICLDRFPEETFQCLDFKYLSNSLNSIAEKYEEYHGIIVRIFEIITPPEE